MKNSQHPIENGFNFDEWAALARTDPEGFAHRRLAWIQTTIANAPEKSHVRLERLQFRIDAKRRLARAPMKACLNLSSMMWDSFFDLKETLTPFSGQTTFHGLRPMKGQRRRPFGQTTSHDLKIMQNCMPEKT